MKTVIIGIAGGTGSGKSTFTNRLKDEFKDQVAVLYHDNYYRAQDDIPFEERKKVNYDHPDAFETELLIEHIKQLKEGHAIQCPVYDYAAHNRSKEVVEIQPKTGDPVRGNPGAGRSAVKRSSGYQGICGGRCRRAYLKAGDPRCKGARQRLRGCSRPVSDHRKADALSVCGANQSFG